MIDMMEPVRDELHNYSDQLGNLRDYIDVLPDCNEKKELLEIYKHIRKEYWDAVGYLNCAENNRKMLINKLDEAEQKYLFKEPGDR